MKRLVSVAMVVAASAAPAAMPAASAEARTSGLTALKARVVGQPYPAGRGRTAVPVLLDAKLAKRAKLSSPAGVVVIAAKRTLVAPRKRFVRTRLLRVNDRIAFRSTIPAAARHAASWRLATRRARITARSSTLSAAELQQRIKAVRKDLTSLYRFTAYLTSFTAANFADLRTQIGGLRADVNDLRAGVAALRTSLADLAAQVEAARRSLQSQIDALGTDLAAVKTELQALEAQMATLQTALASLTTTVNNLSTSLTTLSTTMTTVQGAVTTLQTNLTSVNTTLTQLLSGQSSAASAIVQLQSDALAMLTELTGTGSIADLASSRLDGALNSITTLNTTTSGLTTSLASVTSTVQGQLTGADGVFGTADDATSALRTTLSSIQSTATTALTNAATAQSGVNTLTATVCDPNGLVDEANALRTAVSAFDNQTLTVLGGVGLTVKLPDVTVPPAVADC